MTMTGTIMLFAAAAVAGAEAKLALRECYDGRPDVEWLAATVRDPAEAERIARDFHGKYPNRLMGYRRTAAGDGVAAEMFKAIERATGYRAASCLAGDAKDAGRRFAAQAKIWQVGATYAENGDGTMHRLDARPPSGRRWKLDWAEEFAGAELDTNRWTAVDCWHGGEPQFYTARRRNVRVENGVLVLENHRERFDTLTTEKTGRSLAGARTGRSYDPKRRFAEFTGGCVVTAGKVLFKYGRMEIRAKIPTGLWSWPALWMMGENIKEIGWPRCGEIDIMEYWGKGEKAVFGTCHIYRPDSVYGAESGNPHVGSGDGLHGVDVENGFHVYAIEWLEDRIDFFFDDVHYFTWPVEVATVEKGFNPMREPMYLLMNYALDPGVGPVDGKFSMPRRFEIDYVRHYRLENPGE